MLVLYWKGLQNIWIIDEKKKKRKKEKKYTSFRKREMTTK